MYLDKWFSKEELQLAALVLEKAYGSESKVFPDRKNVFKAFEFFAPGDCKVCIIGQDPYHKSGQAHGLSFSVPVGVKLPPSLKNIYKELAQDLGVVRTDGDLSDWAKQGVLLLNTCLTVVEGKAGSHKNLDWQEITRAAILKVLSLEKPVVFIVWGDWALKTIESMAAVNQNNNHLIISSPHPSPLSAYRGFFGSKPFSSCNNYLLKTNQSPICW